MESVSVRDMMACGEYVLVEPEAIEMRSDGGISIAGHVGNNVLRNGKTTFEPVCYGRVQSVGEGVDPNAAGMILDGVVAYLEPNGRDVCYTPKRVAIKYENVISIVVEDERNG